MEVKELNGDNMNKVFFFKFGAQSTDKLNGSSRRTAVKKNRIYQLSK